MTQINPYGIGAGRMISSGTDDDERARQRRLTASQLSEQSRKSAAMREQLAEAARAGARAEAQQRQQEAQAGAVRRERQGRPLATGAEKPPPKNPEFPSAQLLSPARLAGSDLPAPPETSRLQPGHDVDSSSGSDTGILHAGETPGLLMSRLIDELPAWRAQPSTAGLETRLTSLRQSISALGHSPEQDSRESLEAMAGSLEFVQGYLEASSLPEEAREQLVLHIELIRQDVTVMLSAMGNPPAGVNLAMPPAAQKVSEATRAQGAAGRHRLERAHGSASGKAAGTQTEDKEAVASTAGGWPSMPPSWSEPAKTAVPSQDRDIDKRRNETPVSVAIRSI